MLKFSHQNHQIGKVILGKIKKVNITDTIGNFIDPFLTPSAIKVKIIIRNILRFFIVPLGGVNTVAKYIGSQDTTYSSLFLHDSWREILEKAEPSSGDVAELVSRVEQYVNSCGSTDDNLMHLPIAEAMVTYKEKRFNILK